MKPSNPIDYKAEDGRSSDPLNLLQAWLQEHNGFCPRCGHDPHTAMCGVPVLVLPGKTQVCGCDWGNWGTKTLTNKIATWGNYNRRLKDLPDRK